jgi:hypothetical protein
MIVFINCKISDIRLSHYNRYNLRNDNRFDIARYCFSSFAPLSPIVSRFIFYLELADGFFGQEKEMEEWLCNVLPNDKLSLYWHRCNNVTQWKEAAKEINAIDDDLVYPAGNEDHAFFDSNIDIFNEGLKLIQNDADPHAVLMTSHYPEWMRYSYKLGGQLSESGNFVISQDLNWDAIRVMKKEFFNWHINSISDPNKLIFRTENWYGFPSYPKSKIYAPTKEQFRHFDGYSHVLIGPEVVPPIEIPIGFFDRAMKIRYGFNDIDLTSVNINPLTDKLKTVDSINGVDYKFTLADLPAFWKPFIKEIIISPNLDQNKARQARNQNHIDMTQLNLRSPYGDFNSTNLNPNNWIKNHMLTIDN